MLPILGDWNIAVVPWSYSSLSCAFLGSRSFLHRFYVTPLPCLSEDCHIMGLPHKKAKLAVSLQPSCAGSSLSTVPTLQSYLEQAHLSKHELDTDIFHQKMLHAAKKKTPLSTQQKLNQLPHKTFVYAP